MNTEQRLTDLIYSTIEQLAADGQADFRPGDLADALRAAGSPMLSWKIRGELSRLEAAGLLQVSKDTGAYSRTNLARKTG